MNDLRRRVIDALDVRWRSAEPTAAWPHRQLQQVAEAASYWALLVDDRSSEPVEFVLGALALLSDQQDEEIGLFIIGDNVLSPPDTSFTINGLARLALILDGVDGPWSSVRKAVVEVIDRTSAALERGGVHTPNHRWELASALAQSARVLDRSSLNDRARRWLAEGIDIQADGQYSERSANYAAHVSNPSLGVLARELGERSLLEIVHRNLHSQTLLTDAVGNVVTLHSRRQDQAWPEFSAAAFEFGYRLAAKEFDCAECRTAAHRCGLLGGGDPIELAAGLLKGEIDETDHAPSVPRAGAGWTDLPPSELSLYRDDARELLVRAASDVAAVGRVCSGLNHNPTFLSYRHGALAFGLRLSRSFFGLGPFRADELHRDGDSVVLREAVETSYYQPLEPGRRRDDGAYALSYEGRFAGRLGFADRDRDRVRLETSVVVTVEAEGVVIRVESRGPSVPLSLELAFAEPAPTVDGATQTADPQHWTTSQAVTIETPDGARWRLDVEGAAGEPTFYEPGEAVRYSGGSDALAGTRLGIGWRSGAPMVLRLHPEVLA